MAGGAMGGDVRVEVDIRVHLALILAGCGYGGYFVLTKAALSAGVNRFVFSVYRDVIGCSVLALYASCFERRIWSRISVPVVGLMISMGFIGVYVQQTFFLFGLQYTNVLFASAMMNCIPVWTYLIAAIFRVEEVRYDRRDGQAKILGILACVAGASIMTLYKGPALFGALTPKSPPYLILPETSSLLGGLFATLNRWGISEWQLGALCLLCTSIACGTFVNLQVPSLKRFPAPFSLMAATTFFGAIMLAITAYLTVSNPSQWFLTPGPDLISAIYAGVIASAMNLFLHCWANHRGGPLLLAAYVPVQTIFSVILSYLFLDDVVYLGSLLGATVVLSGLYLVTWGQREDRRIRSLSLEVLTPCNLEGIPAVKPVSTLEEPLLG